MPRHLIALLCAGLRVTTAELTLRERLVRCLHDLAHEGRGARFRHRFSQGEFAVMLGVTREAVNKQLAAMAADGLIAWDG